MSSAFSSAFSNAFDITQSCMISVAITTAATADLTVDMVSTNNIALATAGTIVGYGDCSAELVTTLTTMSTIVATGALLSSCTLDMGVTGVLTGLGSISSTISIFYDADTLIAADIQQITALSGVFNDTLALRGTFIQTQLLTGKVS